ncbi:hypothetical protein GALMADRAFT_136355 [Galerina marginata CBS 339.88]|uniref:Uncharacterized protein n=1 Tax=Galerina marginata (strain CBS 339.88) TaxID=685588 RepID=A0A067TIJ4_GALM3|nr:hypothetical protein GALMADRAFT_136355 [Galerina marginata CBS 339.88]
MPHEIDSLSLCRRNVLQERSTASSGTFPLLQHGLSPLPWWTASGTPPARLWIRVGNTSSSELDFVFLGSLSYILLRSYLWLLNPLERYKSARGLGRIKISPALNTLLQLVTAYCCYRLIFFTLIFVSRRSSVLIAAQSPAHDDVARWVVYRKSLGTCDYAQLSISSESVDRPARLLLWTPETQVSPHFWITHRITSNRRPCRIPLLPLKRARSSDLKMEMLVKPKSCLAIRFLKRLMSSR